MSPGRAFLLTLGIAAGCTAPHRVLPPLPQSDPVRVLETVREREDRVVSLRARFTADTRREEERHSAQGVLLVKKPDRFRLRMMLPFGLTVFDYVSVGEHAQLALPLEGHVIDGPPQGPYVAFSQDDLGQAFLRGPHAFPGTCTPDGTEALAIVVWCRAPSGVTLRQIRIDAQTGTIREEASYADGQPRMVIFYDDYRDVDESSLPYRIRLLYPAQNLQLDIAIQRYEVNPRLGDELFQPIKPWAGA